MNSSQVVSIFKRWVAACTAGELLGFGAAAFWAWLAMTVFGADPSSTTAKAGVLGFMVLAGVFEGVVLGFLQWLMLRTIFPNLKARSWLAATVSVAALGWFLGMLLPLLLASDQTDGSSEPSTVLVLVAAAGFGAVVGAAFGFAQWLVLRRHAPNASRWVLANSLGWAIGLPWSYLAGGVADISQSVLFGVIVGMAAGTLMGASVAIVTGFALIRLSRGTKSPGFDE